jgi:hypothetical protein
MTTARQLEANRRNALKSTGPRTINGKQASRRNALRHGLTAETLIEPLEDAESYRTFEAAIVAEYLPQSPVEKELVHRLASLFWRLRRATSIETGLLRLQSEILQGFRSSRQKTIKTETSERRAPKVSVSAAPIAPARKTLRFFPESLPQRNRPTRRATSRSASCGSPTWTARWSIGSADTSQASGASSCKQSLLCRRSSVGREAFKWLCSACAGRPARSRWCKSTAMKEQRSTSAPSRALRSARGVVKRRQGSA